MLSISASAQINMADSTAQVIAYFDKGERQSYTVTIEKFRIKESDTISKKLTSYDVDITVLDSTKNSYTIQWIYGKTTSDEENEFAQKLLNLNSELKVIFKTDELGSFTEVLNWKEIRDYMNKRAKILEKDLKSFPEMASLFKQIQMKFASKEVIEALAIRDIQQFHTFHGANYQLGEVLEGTIETPNVFGSKPFDTYTTLFLDEIDEEDKTVIVRATQKVDSQQLTDATFKYLEKVAKTLKTTVPKRSDIKNLTNEIEYAARIHTSGWPLSIWQEVSIFTDNITAVEKRTIEIK